MTALAPRPQLERGSATAEFAMIMPALMLIVCCVLGAGSIGLAQLKAYEAARSAAREAARGEPRADIVQAATRTAGTDSRVKVDSEGSYTTVTVTVAVPKSVRFIVPNVEASARARTEPSNGTAEKSSNSLGSPLLGEMLAGVAQ